MEQAAGAIEQAAARGAARLLTHVYAHHAPPARNAATLPPEAELDRDDRTLARALKLAAVAYHPDKDESDTKEEAQLRELISQHVNAARSKLIAQLHAQPDP